jgi:hypothetical protein
VADAKDRQLFFSSTTMQVGNGKATPFWESRWLEGRAPKDLAPHLYAIAKFKKRLVHDEMRNDNWIRGLRNIHTTQQIEEFTMLFIALASVTLTNQEDEINWKWTTNGKYSVFSAYECQFIGAMSHFSVDDIWRAITEPECQFFAWLVLHNNVLTVDSMAKKHWNCNPLCSLCLCISETTPHLLAECNFTEATWNLISHRFNLPNYSVISSSGGLEQWMQLFRTTLLGKERRKKIDILFSFWW